MQRLIVAGSVLVLAASIGRAEPIADLVQERVRLLAELTGALERKDESTVKPLVGKLEENNRKLKEAMNDVKRQVDQAEERAQKALDASGLKIDLSRAGLRGDGGADRLIQEMIRQMYAMADAVEKKDAARAKELQKGLEDLGKRVQELKLSETEQKRLQERYGADLEKATKRLADATAKAMKP